MNSRMSTTVTVVSLILLAGCASTKHISRSLPPRRQALLATVQNGSSSPAASDYERQLLKNLQQAAAANNESCDATLQRLAKELTPILLSKEKKSAVGEQRDAQRRADVNAILNAVYQYTIDNNGKYPASIPAASTKICADSATNCKGALDFSPLRGTYLVRIPKDPSYDGQDSGYTIQLVNGKLTVSAPHTEGSTPITVIR